MDEQGIVYSTECLCPRGFPGGSDGKEPACRAGDLGLNPGSGRFPGEGNDCNPPVFLLGDSHGQRSLVGYSPRGRKQPDPMSD